jgi:hypothetical protein
MHSSRRLGDDGATPVSFPIDDELGNPPAAAGQQVDQSKLAHTILQVYDLRWRGAGDNRFLMTLSSV